ncbi:MAG: F0F1 ATP synthase subunit A [Bacteroidota bacterium]
MAENSIMSHMQHWVIGLGPLSFNLDTILYSLGVSVFLLGIAFLATRRMRLVPGSLQSLVEMLVELVENMSRANIGEKGPYYMPFFATLLFYIFIANMVGLIPGLRSPTADINVAFGLAFSVVIAMQYASIKSHGVGGWLKHFFRPNFLFFFLHLLELITRPLTLALRLFGNIFAGEMLIVILYSLMPVVVPTLWLAFSVAIGAIQAYIFAVLSMAYTGMVVEE